ncbi:adenosylcobinamide-GDP ribazoletransferase [Telmatospirillum siberiense]|uniref:Adenosylcobinamide-GDP ribazoletransferase n=2 Tax=Telmatospirillum siberiense TaxID=382514 RepID=A0A2N3PQU8_9PROT|nr:adenosylcobinamide-GDP ribazoletransferase [Telmatospirillum siberiense]
MSDALPPSSADRENEAVRLGPLAAFHMAISFLTRLPLPSPRHVGPGALAKSMHLFPLAGVVVGATGALTYALASLLLPPPLSALLAVAATATVTGAMHEDGLADIADGFGGGVDRERKLAIMKDSRLGSYGAVALLLGLSLKAFALAALASPGWVAGALIAAHALGRAAIPLTMQLLAPARETGLGATVGTPSISTAGIGATLALLIAAAALPAGAAFAACMAALVATLGVAWLAWRQIGGQTGDVLGATEQVAEIAVLLAAVAFR